MTFGEKFSERVKSRRGRPRRAVPTISVHVRIDEQVYDTYCRQAITERVALHSVLQRTLTTAAPKPQLRRA